MLRKSSMCKTSKMTRKVCNSPLLPGTESISPKKDETPAKLFVKTHSSSAMVKSPLKACNSIQKMLDYFNSQGISHGIRSSEIRTRDINVADFISYLAEKSNHKPNSVERKMNNELEDMGLKIKKINLENPCQLEQFENVAKVKKNNNHTFLNKTDYNKIFPCNKTNFWKKRHRNPSVQELLKRQRSNSKSPVKPKVVAYPFAHIKKKGFTK
ncbi:unnamed protein product [Moneuplotes crassus]|uniref:Uncharacterized protein n=1 Tax=Euplotes crassus TaxID=5936 RepID=A0AAD1X9R9_EUPCR|nr:unnamed protein product [Moneuplotes crassus]